MDRLKKALQHRAGCSILHYLEQEKDVDHSHVLTKLTTLISFYRSVFYRLKESRNQHIRKHQGNTYYKYLHNIY